MQDITESNNKIQQISDVIGQISDKTAVIDEIVFQTKLLSFNAAVEAENAGEYGKGFSVVAQEVGNLAKTSGDAALEITTIVKESLNTVESITNHNKKKVEIGNQILEETASLLSEVSNELMNVSTHSQQILNASKEQFIGIEQINNSVSRLDKTTGKTSDISQQQERSSKELLAQASEIRNIVHRLEGIVSGSRTN